MYRNPIRVSLMVAGVLAITGAARAERVIHVDDDAPTGGDGSSWGSAFVDLQDALAVAGTGDVVRVAQGTYAPAPAGGERGVHFVMIDGVALLGGYAGLGASDPDARDVLAFVTTLTGDLDGNDGSDFEGNGENSYHVVVASGTDSSAVLDGFTVTGGNADAEDGPNCRGAGVYNLGGSPTIRNCILTANHTDDQGDGGGMFNGEGAAPSVLDCAFIGNHSGWGAGMHNLNGSAPIVAGTFFIGNEAVANGGGMLNYNQSSPTISRSFFWGNVGRAGGGIANGAASSPTIDNSVIVQCFADTRGGAISNYLGSNPSVTNCTIVSNFAGSVGGIMSYDDSVANVSSTIFWRNLDPRGFVEAAQVWVVGEGIVGVAHSCIMGWTGNYGGAGNIGDDPLLIQLRGDLVDLHLSPQSAAINAGDPKFAPGPSDRDLDGHYRKLCDRVDMGAYEFGQGDYDCDDFVDLADLAHWADCASGPAGEFPDGCEAFDFDIDGDTDLEDYSAFSELAFHQPARAFLGNFCPFSPDPLCVQPEPYCVYTVEATSSECEGSGIIEGDSICLMPCPSVCPPSLEVEMLDVPGCRVLLDDSGPVCIPCRETTRILIGDPRW